jgi:hypothetical protein
MSARELTIQRVPRGLLDLLSMKGTGRTPTELQDRLQGTIDLTQSYLQDRLVTAVFSTAAVAAVGDVNAIGSNVPPGELWIAYHLAIAATVAAGNSYRLVPAVFRRTGTVIGNYGPRAQAYAATERVCLGWDLQGSFLWPGDSVGLGCEQVTAGTTAFSVYLYHAKLTI